MFSILLLCSLGLSSVHAQFSEQKQDSLPTFMIDALVVTADRMKNTVSNSTSAVSFIGEQELRFAPGQKISDALNSVPGFFVVNKDGLGREPIISSRGFYGGGEAEYCVVLVDGKTVNDIETGLVNWNLVPLSAISSIEIVRGSSSPLYGDAALGGIVNIITQKEGVSRTTMFMDGGSHDSYSAGVRRYGNLFKLPYQFHFSNERTHGFRDHSDWQGTTIGGDVYLQTGDRSRIQFSSLSQWTSVDEPGPLSASQYSTNNKQSSPFYKADGRKERRNQAEIMYNNILSGTSEFSATLLFHHKSANNIRTFSNSAVEIDPSTFAVVRVTDTLFGDTKERDVTTNEISLTSKYSSSFDLGGLSNRMLLGLDVSGNFARSLYFTVFSGLEEDYHNQVLSRANNTSVVGTAARGKYAFYVSDELKLNDQLAMTAGARFDYIADRYHGDNPETTMTSYSSAFSPKVGLNYRYANTESFSGSVYANVNRSFKAPTIDQLSDQRPIDAGVFADFGGGPMFLTFQASPFSNMDLKPQRATSYELGAYTKTKLGEQLFAEFSLAGYRLDVKDEIDFDLATLRYQNILESRHQGVEAGMKLYWLRDVTVGLNYTYNEVTSRAGNYSGKYLKGIPRNVWNVSIGYRHVSGFQGSMSWSALQTMYLDDDNIAALPDFNTVNAKFAYSYSPLLLFVESANLFNKKYSSTGYRLNGVDYLFPAAGRTIRGGFEVEL